MTSRIPLWSGLGLLLGVAIGGAAPAAALPGVPADSVAAPVAQDPGRAAGASPDSALIAAPRVDDLVTTALARSPTLAALAARVRAARFRVRSAGAWPNPMLDLTLQDAGLAHGSTDRSEMSMIGPELTQSLPYPGKRAARRASARADAEVEGAGLAALRRQVVRDVRVTCANLYAVDHEMHCQASALDLLDLLTATARQRQATGLADQAALLRVQLSAARVRERQADLAAERAGLVAALNTLLDRPGDAPLGEVKELPPTDAAPIAWADSAVARSAEVEVRRRDARAAEVRARLARVEGRPDFTARAGVGLRDKLDPVWTLGVGLELPLWNGQGRAPLVAAAREELEAARQELRAAEAMVRGTAARLKAEEERARLQRQRYDEAIVPQTSLAFDAARSAYVAGRGDFAAVIEQFDMWLEARARLARREADVYVAWAERDALLNAPPAGPGEDR